MTINGTAGAREDILRRVRTALADVKQINAEDVAAEWSSIDRRYTRSGVLPRHDVLDVLEDRLRDYDANVIRARSGGVGAAIAELLSDRGLTRLVVPQGLAEVIEEALPGGFDFVEDEGLSAQELDGFEGVITASTCAIAETGTIVLQNVSGQGRRAPTLIPDYHLCIVRTEQVVETVPEAMAMLEDTSILATTFFSGPSATADIEMTRIKGVHGPRFLDVILVS